MSAPSYCCPRCGEQIGWLGRLFNAIVPGWHQCSLTLHPSMSENLTTDDFDEFCTYWWGSETDERTITDAIEDGSMTTFAKALLTWFSE